MRRKKRQVKEITLLKRAMKIKNDKDLKTISRLQERRRDPLEKNKKGLCKTHGCFNPLAPGNRYGGICMNCYYLQHDASLSKIKN